MAAVIGFAGYSDSGKTTLICSLIDIFQSKGKKVAVIKHDGHGHYKEAEGKDTSLYKQAGASAFVAVSPGSYTRFEREDIRLNDAVRMFEGYDYIFVEGFKKENHPKVAVFRSQDQADILEQLTVPPIAVAAGFPYSSAGNTPIFDLNDTESIAVWLERYLATMSAGHL